MQSKKFTPKFYIVILILLFSLLGCQKEKKFNISDEAQFYVLNHQGIVGYHIENGQPEEIIRTEVEVIKTNINPVVHRGELANRYLVFTEEDWPKGNQEGLVSIDFENGLINYLPTDHIAYTSAGSSSNYYFASTSSSNSNLAIFTPKLEEVGYLEFENPMIFNDFITHSDQLYLIGTDVHETTNENGISRFKTRLIKIRQTNQEFVIDFIKEIAEHEDKQYWFDDTIIKNGYLYSSSAGYRDLKSLERVMESAIYRYDLTQEYGEFFPLDTIAPQDIYDIGEDYLAITHNSSFLNQLGLTLFEYSTGKNKFIEINSMDNEEIIVDIKRLDSNNLLILTNKRLLGYDLLNNQIAFDKIMNQELGNPFHIWMNQ